MHSWILLRRLRGPAFLILVGITALLNQWGILRFSRSWPLYLILAGIFGLLERAVLGGPVPPVYPGAYPGAYPNAYPVAYPANNYDSASGSGHPSSASGATPVVIDASTDADRRP